MTINKRIQSPTLFVSSLFILTLCVGTAVGQVREEDLPPKKRATELTVSGRVVDANGKPMAGTQVIVAASERGRSCRPIGIYMKNGLPYMTEVIGPVMTDQEGRYRIEVPKSPSGYREGLDVYAAAKKHGYAMKQLGWKSDQIADLQLSEEHVVRGRVVDLKGQPIADATIRVLLDDPGKDQKRDGWWRNALRAWHPHGLDIWRTTQADDKGRFLVRGLNAEKVALQFEEDNSTSHHHSFDTYPVKDIKSVTVALSPAKRLFGVITYADSGKPVVGAKIVTIGDHLLDPRWTETQTDEMGRYSINAFAIDSFSGRDLHILNIFPPEGAPYMVHQENLPVSRAARREVDIKLQRGVLVHGKVVDAASGEPIAGARIQCSAAFINAVSVESSEPSRLLVAISKQDGSYQLPVPKESSLLYVMAPTLDYVPQEISRGELERGKLGGRRIFADATLKLELDGSETEKSLDIELRPGATLRCKVVDGEGKAVEFFVATSPSYNPIGYHFKEPALFEGRNGLLELPGCDPTKEHVVSIFDYQNRQGTTVVLDGSDAEKPRTVQLEACGKATARLIDENGEPIGGYTPRLGYVINEGVVRTGNHAESPLKLDYGAISWIQPGWKGDQQVVSDANGMITFPELIPGLPYEFFWFPEIKRADDLPLNAPMYTFSVKAGEHKELGDVVLSGVRSQTKVVREKNRD